MATRRGGTWKTLPPVAEWQMPGLYYRNSRIGTHSGIRVATITLYYCFPSQPRRQNHSRGSMTVAAISPSEYQ
ncbi:hypothetical protein CD178_01075 [Komagataeibacter saccharivorans]|uniref:Uncharacterized protein n=1 Tax=Komagataeibacter saccharivorans TaxID=265959 RepID=A0A347WAH7_9PROT|nr:hypothetical protein CD178_01075 [Komagataeibacter saccharivorans]